jgi:hypothetical protein
MIGREDERTKGREDESAGVTPSILACVYASLWARDADLVPCFRGMSGSSNRLDSRPTDDEPPSRPGGGLLAGPRDGVGRIAPAMRPPDHWLYRFFCQRRRMFVLLHETGSAAFSETSTASVARVGK